MIDQTEHRQYRAGAIGAAVAGREVTAFFVLTLAVSWALWVPIALDAVALPVLPLIVLGGFGPAVAAAATTWLAGDSLRAWVRPILDWRVHPQWYALALGIPVLAVALQSGVYAALGNAVAPSVVPERLPGYVVGLAFVLVLGGGQEEPGWRGFALPRLQARYGPLLASLAIGAVWALWHLPLFVVPASSQYGLPIVAYTVAVLALSVVFTWLYNASGASVLLVMLLHAGVNASTTLYPITAEALGGGMPDVLAWAMAGVYWAIALALLAVSGGDLGADDAATAERTDDGVVPASGSST